MSVCDHIVKAKGILGKDTLVKRLLREVLGFPGAERILEKNSLTLSTFIVLRRFRSRDDDACIDCERFVQSYEKIQSTAEEFESIVEQYLCGSDIAEIFAPMCTRQIYLKCGAHGQIFTVHCPSSFGLDDAMMMHMVHAMTNQGMRRLRSIEKDSSGTLSKPKPEIRQVRRNQKDLNVPDSVDSTRGALKEAMQQGEAMQLVKDALLNPYTFNSIGKVLHVDPGLDFGVHCMRKSEPLGDLSTLLEYQEWLHLRGNDFMHRDRIRICFQNQGELWLCGAVAVPRLPSTFLHVDESNLFLLEESKPLRLQKSIPYYIDVTMSTEDTPGRVEEMGYLEQSLLYIFAYPTKTRYGTTSKEDALLRNKLRTRKIGWVECQVQGREYLFFCLRSRLATILLKQKEYMMFQKPLNFKAKPFYSKRLEQIFDVTPDYICCEFPEEEKASLMVDRQLLVHPARDAMTVDALRYDGLNFHSMSYYQKKYTRLVQIEARQQILDIRCHDMHYVRPIPVVFDKSNGNQRKCWVGDDDHLKIYRGFMSQRMNNRRGKPSLIAIRVPSILEGQPSVHLGTIVRVKSSEQKGHEYEFNMICCGIDGTLVFLLPPVGFWEETPLGRAIESCKGQEKDLFISIRFGYSSRAMRRMLDVPISKFMFEDSRASFIGNTSLLPQRKDVEKLSLELQSRSFLNEQQATAISSVVSGSGRIAPFSIIGPPGTGKTFTLTHCVCEILNQYPCAKILCCAPQNFSADIICSELRKKGINSKKMLRLNDPRRPIYSTKEDVLDYCCMDDTGTFRVPGFRELDEFSVIVCTCLSSEYLRPESRTHVLIDEAGQALLPESLLPLQALCCDRDPLNTGWGSILCGDPKQLGPIVRNKLASECGLQKSLLQVLSEGKNWNGLMLCQNYRSSNALLNLPSKLFYSESLYYAGEDSDSVLPPSFKWNIQKEEEALPCVFYGVNGKQIREGDSSSFMNKIEAMAVVDLVVKLLENDSISEDDIGVLAMYRKQVYLIRKLFRDEGLRKIRVGTIEDYQGQEERIIIISTVLSDLNDLPLGSFARSFFQNPNRFNVAITRAKALLVAIGNPTALAQDSNWKTFIRHCYARSSVFGARSAEIDSACNEVDEGGEEAILSAISQIAALGPGTANMVDDFDPFDEDCPWRIMI